MDNIEYLNMMHHLQDRATEAIEFLDAFVKHDGLPLPLRAQFLETQGTLKLQKVAIKNLVDGQLEIGDRLEKLTNSIGDTDASR